MFLQRWHREPSCAAGEREGEEKKKGKKRERRRDKRQQEVDGKVIAVSTWSEARAVVLGGEANERRGEERRELPRLTPALYSALGKFPSWRARLTKPCPAGGALLFTTATICSVYKFSICQLFNVSCVMR